MNFLKTILSFFIITIWATFESCTAQDRNQYVNILSTVHTINNMGAMTDEQWKAELTPIQILCSTAGKQYQYPDRPKPWDDPFRGRMYTLWRPPGARF